MSALRVLTAQRSMLGQVCLLSYLRIPVCLADLCTETGLHHVFHLHYFQFTSTITSTPSPIYMKRSTKKGLLDVQNALQTINLRSVSCEFLIWISDTPKVIHSHTKILQQIDNSHIFNDCDVRLELMNHSA
jgi:hypothetical protein